jgi:glycerate 2-kinase
MRNHLLKIFSTSLQAVQGDVCVREFLAKHAFPGTKVRVIAIGKAAASMLQGVLAQRAEHVEAALVITKRGHTGVFTAQPPVIIQMESGHPYPDQCSLAAGMKLLEFIDETPPTTGFLFLVSGGASALVEVLPPGGSADQLREFNRWLLAQGWPIEVMNQLRKSVSMIKAGRLANRLAGHAVLQLLISDVPGDDPSVIGSGLLFPNQSHIPITSPLPAWLRRMQNGIPASPAAGDACFQHIESHVIASNRQLREEVCRLVRESGYRIGGNAGLDGDAAEQGSAIAHLLIEGEPGVYVWGGETLVRLPEHPGQGGRCQHLALAAARVLAGQQGIAILAVGTDGTDGPGDVAGALVDGQTLTRARDAGYPDAAQALADADAGRFLAASGDLVDTGPTGTNVMDLVIGLKI